VDPTTGKPVSVADPATGQPVIDPATGQPVQLQIFIAPSVPSANDPGSPTGMSMPWVGIITPQPMMGQFIRQVWVEPQIVAIQLYVPQPDGIPEQWQTQLAQIPGYWATEMTQGTIYPPRWTLENPGVGVYTWRALPGYFQPRR